MRGQHTRPLAIPSLGLVRIMLAAIGFDHEATPQTAEVGDIGPIATCRRKWVPCNSIRWRSAHQSRFSAGVMAARMRRAKRRWPGVGRGCRGLLVVMGRGAVKAALMLVWIAPGAKGASDQPRIPHPVPLGGPTLPTRGRVNAA